MLPLSEALALSVSGAAPGGNAGVSAVLIRVPGGHWNDSGVGAHCSRRHLEEHVLGRALYASLGAQKLNFGYAVDAQTSVDTITVLIRVGGGLQGREAALRALKAVDFAAALSRYGPEERLLIEEEVKFDAPQAVATRSLIAALPLHLRPRLTGKCVSSAPWRSSQWNLLNHAVILSEEADTGTQPLRRSRISDWYYRSADGSAALADSLTPAATSNLYFTPISADLNWAQNLIASLAEWRMRAGPVAPIITPVGTMGYLVALPKSGAHRDDQPAWSSTRLTIDRKAAHHWARDLVCSRRVSRPRLADALLLSVDSWAYAATFTTLCDATRTEDPVAHRRSLPLPRATPIAQLEADASLDKSRPVEVMEICRRDRRPTSLSSYERRTTSRVLLNTLRFERGITLSVLNIQSKREACGRFVLIGRVAPRSEVENAVASIFIDKGYAARVTNARQAECLFLPERQRHESGGVGCERTPDATELDRLRSLLSGSISWE